MQTPTQLDRLPPHDIPAEQSVLGAILLDPLMGISTCAGRIAGESFYDMRHQALYDAIIEMHETKGIVGPVELQSWLRDRNQLAESGGMDYIAGLINLVPSAASLEYFLEIVEEKARLRRVIQICTATVASLYDSPHESGDILERFARDSIAAMDTTTKAMPSAKELVRMAVDEIEKSWQNKGNTIGIPSGFPDLDKLTSGFQPGDMIVIAARPSVGKTSIAMGIAENIAADQGIPVGVFSLEMTGRALMIRMLCSRARVNIRSIRDGLLAERDFPKITRASGQLSVAPIFIDDSSGLEIRLLKAKARRMYQQHGVKIIIIDYLTLLRAKGENRQQEIAHISGSLKAIAKELNIPVIVLAQLNRELEKDKNRKPRLSDLRESGAIEQDADFVGLLYKPKPKDDDDENATAQAVNMLIAKQRNGPTGEVYFTFLKDFTRYESASKVSEVPSEYQNPYND